LEVIKLNLALILVINGWWWIVGTHSLGHWVWS
jgi:hypothetical protein